MVENSGVARRTFLRASVGVFGLSLLAACAPQAPASKPAEPAKPAEAPKPAAAAQPAAATQPPDAATQAAAAAATPAAAAQPAEAANPAAPKPAAAAVKPDDKIGRHLIGQLEGPTIVADVPKAFKEAPQLAELVKAGTLPPVAERIGQDPIVVKP